MPNHKTHDTIGFITAPIVAGGAALVATQVGHNPIAAAGAMGVCHVAATWFLSPDLDLDSAIDDRWGPLAWVWWPYREIVPHRSLISHSLVGGLLRIGYLCMPFILLVWLFDWQFTDVWYRLQAWEQNVYGVYLVAGIVTADLHHIAADKILTESKATARKLLPRWLYKAIIR